MNCAAPLLERERRRRRARAQDEARQARARWTFVEGALGEGEICPRCRATLDTYDTACTASLAEQCPGFCAIEDAIRKFYREQTP